jgi:hypothetical protein
MPIVVHVQAADCSTANRGNANDFCTVFAPNEVISPIVFAGIEEGLFGLGFGVDGCGEVVAATIATDAGKGKVFRVIATVKGLGEDVVEGENGCAACFGGVAVFAQEVRSFADELAGGAINWHGAWRIQR